MEGGKKLRDHSPANAGPYRGARGPGEVKGGGQRADVEVPHRHDPALGGDHHRVGLGGVQLDLEDVTRVAEGVAGRAVDLREAAEGQGVLGEPGCVWVPPVTAFWQYAQPPH